MTVRLVDQANGGAKVIPNGANGAGRTPVTLRPPDLNSNELLPGFAEPGARCYPIKRAGSS